MGEFVEMDMVRALPSADEAPSFIEEVAGR
jgi:hypothetical protein